MKTSTLYLLLLGLGLSLALDARGQFTSIQDDFSTNGALAGSTPDSGVGNWATITNLTGTAGTISAAAGQVLLPAGTSDAVQLNFAASDQNAGTYYLAFDFTVGTAGSISSSNTIQAIAGFRSSTPASGNNLAGFGVFRPSSAAQTFSSLPDTTTTQVVVGVFSGLSRNASTTPLTAWSTPLNRGTTYRAVLGLNLSADTLTLWINPEDITSPSVVAADISGNARGMFLRSGNNSTGDISIGNLLGDSDFPDVLIMVPEPAQATAIVGISVLSLYAVRRRRKGN